MSNSRAYKLVLAFLRQAENEFRRIYWPGLISSFREEKTHSKTVLLCATRLIAPPLIDPNGGPDR